MDDQLGRIRRAYDQDPEREWARLETGAQNRLEYLVTASALERHLRPPDPVGRILDAGGGPGRYTIWLASRGHRVTLLDLSPNLLSLARDRIAAAGADVARQVESIVEGSFTDLSVFPDASFDAVLCLGGALSHLIEPDQPRRAIAELRRVARPGALLFISALNYIGAFRAVVQWWRDDQTIRLFRRLRESQVLDIGGDAAPAYFFRPEEFVALLAETGLVVERLYGAEGIGAHLQEERLLALMEDREVWPLWRETLLATADHPSVVGVARSLLAVARR
ncbi:MAG TPA: class I SAM-dependent methyltransferase [Chloroflexota bacterium]|nr:class I SAM-dependent methyltransferase [Chloroflexota bacterium]